MHLPCIGPLLAVIAAAACQAPRRPAAGPAASAPNVLLAATGDVDGVPGPDAIALSADGTLAIGRMSIQVPLEPVEDLAFWRDDSVLRVVALDQRRGVNAVVLTTPTEGIEDPPHRHRMFVVENGAIRAVMDEIIATPRAGLRVPGDATLRYDEGAWTACERRDYPATVPLDEIVLAADATGWFREARRSPSGKQYRCDDLAACPFVYVVDGDRAQRIGEILRDVRGRDAYTLQALGLPAPAGRAMTVRIAEEKPEVTYLDEVFVEIDGGRYPPRACATGVPPAYCAADLQPYIMREGARSISSSTSPPAAPSPCSPAGTTCPEDDRARLRWLVTGISAATRSIRARSSETCAARENDARV